MCILSDGDILDFMGKALLSIEPFVEKNLTPNGCDLRIGELFFPDSEEHITSGSVILHPGRGIAVATMEYLKLSGQVCAQLWLRSSFARKGLLTSFGKVDSGFEGALTIPLYNSSAQDFELKIGDRLLQIVFEKMLSPPMALYDERSGHFQGSVGITLEQFNNQDK
jgi:dCTP deaminase